MYLTPAVWRSSTSLCRQAGLQVIGEGVAGGSFILYHTLEACWLDVPGIVCSVVLVTPTQGNGTLRNRMKMFGTDSVPPVWKQYCL